LKADALHVTRAPAGVVSLNSNHPCGVKSRAAAGATGLLLLLIIFFTAGVAPAQENTRVAIIPFAVSGALEFEGIGPSIPGMLASRMYEMGSFRFVTTVALMQNDQEPSLGALSKEEAAAYAKRFGVVFVISGAIRRRGGMTVFSAQVYGADGRSPWTRVVVPVSNQDDLIPKLIPLAEELAERLRETKTRPAEPASEPPSG
jgi:TolB-like protein